MITDKRPPFFVFVPQSIAAKMKQVFLVNASQADDLANDAGIPGTAEQQQELQRQRQLQQSLQFEQDMLLEREQRFREIEANVLDVNHIMKELSNITSQQSEVIGRVHIRGRGVIVPFLLKSFFLHFCYCRHNRKLDRPNGGQRGERCGGAGQGGRVPEPVPAQGADPANRRCDIGPRGDRHYCFEAEKLRMLQKAFLFSLFCLFGRDIVGFRNGGSSTGQPEDIMVERWRILFFLF